MEKLVRDKITDFSREQQDGRLFRIAAPAERHLLLAAKLVEEAKEVQAEAVGSNSKSSIIEEMGDVLEVFDAICDFYGIADEELFDRMKQKKDLKGGFKNGVVLLMGDNDA